MVKIKLKKPFRDIHTDEVYKENTVIEMTEERVEEAKENLKDKGVFFEVLEEEDKFDREAAKERLKELDVEFSGNAKNETLKKLLEENEKQAETGDQENAEQVNKNQEGEGK